MSYEDRTARLLHPIRHDGVMRCQADVWTDTRADHANAAGAMAAMKDKGWCIDTLTGLQWEHQLCD